LGGFHGCPPYLEILFNYWGTVTLVSSLRDDVEWTFKLIRKNRTGSVIFIAIFCLYVKTRALQKSYTKSSKHFILGHTKVLWVKFIGMFLK
jgi:hypothetical protein